MLNTVKNKIELGAREREREINHHVLKRQVILICMSVLFAKQLFSFSNHHALKLLFLSAFCFRDALVNPLAKKCVCVCLLNLPSVDFCCLLLFLMIYIYS